MIYAIICTSNFSYPKYIIMTDLAEASLYIALLRNADRRNACRDCHLNVAEMAEYQSSDKNRNLAEE